MSAQAVDRDIVARAAAAFAAAEELPEIEVSVLVDLALAIVQAGGEVDANRPAARAVVAAVTTGDLAPALTTDEPNRGDILLTLAEVVPPQRATQLADALAATGPVPISPRLAALLGLADANRCASFLAALAEAYGEGSAVVAEAVVEVIVSATDSGVPPPAAAATRWDELLRGDLHGAAEAEIAVGRLRLEARRDAQAAVALLSETVDAVGAEASAVGADAVLGRLGATDGRARALLTDERLFPEERAVLLCAASWESTAGVDGVAVLEVAEALAGAPAARETAAAAHHLLALCARLGDAAAAASIVAKLHPVPWAAWNATWAPTRKRGDPPDAYLDALATAIADISPRPAMDPGPGPAWSLLSPQWQRDYVGLKALPALALPWWRPWEGGLP